MATAPAAMCAINTHLTSRRLPRRTSSAAKAAAIVSAHEREWPDRVRRSSRSLTSRPSAAIHTAAPSTT